MNPSVPTTETVPDAQADSSTEVPSTVAESGASAQPSKGEIAASDTDSAHHAKASDHDLKRLDQALDTMDALLESGQLKQATKAELEARRLFDTLAGLSARQQQSVQHRLTRAQPRLQEMRAWRHWSTTLARESLIEEIESLVESRKSPTAIARKIQEARKTWQDWDRSGDSGGKALWDRFDLACTKAYETCRVHFQHQAEQRRTNREAREALCVRLETCVAETDWHQPDWRALDKLARRCRREWNDAGPVDRKYKKLLDKRFHAAWSQIEDYLSRERERNHKQRRALIEQVRALTGHDDPSRSIAQVKQAQTQWQPTVLSKRHVERELWDEFKSVCDAVFGQRDNHRREEAAVREANAKERIGLCEEIEMLADTADPATVDTVRRSIARAKERWPSIGEAPKKQEAGLDKRFRRACARADQSMRQAERQRAKQSLDHLRARADVCAEIETALLSGSENAHDTLRIANQHWEQLPAAEPGDQQVIVDRLHTASRALNADAAALESLRAQLATNLARGEDLCLQLEVLADVESPPQHAKARMQLQIKRLSAALSGAGGDELLADPEAVRRAYWLTGAIEPAHRQALDARFRSAEAAAKQSDSPTGPTAGSTSS